MEATQEKIKQKIEKKQAKEKENQITIAKLKKENTELQRQIGFLGEICRRCHSAGSIPIEQQFYGYAYSPKNNICEKCDITRCKYSGRYKEPLVKENQNNGVYQNPCRLRDPLNPFSPNMYRSGFTPQQW